MTVPWLIHCNKPGLNVSKLFWHMLVNPLTSRLPKLLAGEMPVDIEAIFQHVGLSLFPQTPRDIGFTCSCPDWGNPCKHAAAVYYLIAEQLDVDPFVLFHLRGRHRQAFEQVLQGYHVGETTPDEVIQPERAITVEGFWEASDVHLVRQMPLQNIEPIALRQLGNPPLGADKELRRIYANVSREAVRWLGLDDS